LISPLETSDSQQSLSMERNLEQPELGGYAKPAGLCRNRLGPLDFYFQQP
jgi:hypothetical protein